MNKEESTNKVFESVNLSCSYCQKTYGDSDKLRRHVNNTHKKERKYECDICSKKYKKIPVFYPYFKLECGLLSIRFAYKHILQEHQNLHFGLKPHVCQFCDKKFAAKSNLIQHNRRHRIENELNAEQKETFRKEDTSLVCNLCSKKFETQELLDKHKGSHLQPTNVLNPTETHSIQANLGVLKCNYCDILFTDHALYFLHIALHGFSAWQCSICHKMLKDKYEFALHFINQQHVN